MTSAAVATSAADVTFSGASSSDEFGTALSAGGDFELDGDGDIVITALKSSTSASGAGSTYLFYGPFSASAVSASAADVELSGVAANDQSGRALAAGMDANADGYSDLLVGAHSADPNGSKSGEAYLIFGTVE